MFLDQLTKRIQEWEQSQKDINQKPYVLQIGNVFLTVVSLTSVQQKAVKSINQKIIKLRSLGFQYFLDNVQSDM